MRIIFCLLSLLLFVGPVYAVQPDEVLSDVALEQRARKISNGLRCLVCQNESIDDSDAPLARDLRVLVRERLLAGEDDAEVKDYIVARYGEFVLLKPIFAVHTILLWLGPVVIFFFGLARLFQFYADRKTQEAEKLKAVEEELLQQILDEERRRNPGAFDRNKLH